MGFFSWKCAKTGLPICYRDRIVLLVKHDDDRVDTYLGDYDGYGTAVGVDLCDVDENKWRLFLAEFYNNENFDDFPNNADEPRQGYFWDDDELRELYQEYMRTGKTVSYGRAW